MRHKHKSLQPDHVSNRRQAVSNLGAQFALTIGLMAALLLTLPIG